MSNNSGATGLGMSFHKVLNKYAKAISETTREIFGMLHLPECYTDPQNVLRSTVHIQN